VQDPSEPVGDPAGLLLHQDLLEHRQAATAQVLRHVDGAEPQLVDPKPVTLDDLGGQVAAVHLRFHLEWDQLVGEGTGSGLDLPVFARHWISHPSFRPSLR
jgi:hypothetical protein